MVNPVQGHQLWQYAVPFLAQNQLILKVIRGEAHRRAAVGGCTWPLASALAAVLWFAAVWRYHQEKLAISA